MQFVEIKTDIMQQDLKTQ